MKNRLGLAGLVLGTLMALVTPSVASAGDRDDYRDRRDGYGYGYRMSPHERHEMREREKRERRARREWLKHHRYDYRYRTGYYNNGYGYRQSYGYYDQWGYWHAY